MNNIAWESLGFSMFTCLLFLLGGTSSGFDGWCRVGDLGNYFQVVRGFHSFYAFVGQISKIQHYFCVNDPRSYECDLSSRESICILLAMFPEGKPIGWFRIVHGKQRHGNKVQRKSLYFLYSEVRVNVFGTNIALIKKKKKKRSWLTVDVCLFPIFIELIAFRSS